MDEKEYERGGSNYANNNSPRSIGGESIGGRDNDQKLNPFSIERKVDASSLATQVSSQILGHSTANQPAVWVPGSALV